MCTSTFSDDFKRDAVAQITERGYPVSEVSERLKAQTGYKRRPGSYGGKPSVVVDIGPVNLCRWFRHRFGKPEACGSGEPARRPARLAGADPDARADRQRHRRRHL